MDLASQGEHFMEREKSNEKVLEMVGEEWNLLKIIYQRRLKFVGHITREDSIEKLSLEGRVEGSRSLGRQRPDFLQRLVTIAGMKTMELLPVAYDRDSLTKHGHQRQILI